MNDSSQMTFNGVFPLSVVVLTRNEAENIERCLSAVAWCDDLIVIDDHSTDGTQEIAERCGARVLTRPFDSFAQQRNWAIRNGLLKNSWSLHLDADEVVTPQLEQAIRQALNELSPDVAAFRMCRKTILRDQWLKYSDGFPVWIMRLVKSGRAEFQDRGHGEVAVPDVDGTLLSIREPFLHYAFSRGLSDWINRHNRYSSREAELEAQQPLDFQWRNIFSRDPVRRRHSRRSMARRLPCRGLFRFMYHYFWNLGFLDGRAGLDFSWLMALYERWIVMKRREIEQSMRKSQR